MYYVKTALGTMGHEVVKIKGCDCSKIFLVVKSTVKTTRKSLAYCKKSPKIHCKIGANLDATLSASPKSRV